MIDLPLIIILGPTAGGKTALSIECANSLQYSGEIISADSMQVYRHMDIGTAKPTLEERAQAPHHLVDMVDPTEPFTVDQWYDLSEQTIGEIRSRGHWPIVVGGTNLYARILLEGMFKGPPADEEYRTILADIETGDLHRQLQEVDAIAAKRIHPNDRKRLTRALEVFHSTGTPISELQKQWSDTGEVDDTARPNTIIIGLNWPVDQINRRINKRVKTMMEQGFLEEVQALYNANQLGRQAREALGYKQLIAHLDGRMDLDDAIERIKIETRRFARKQRTWLKRFRAHRRSLWIDIQEDADAMILDAVTDEALAFCMKQANLL